MNDQFKYDLGRFYDFSLKVWAITATVIALQTYLSISAEKKAIEAGLVQDNRGHWVAKDKDR